MSRITVVIPTRDRRPLLSETITAVMSQTALDWELIVVDDGSTDDTRRFLESLQDPRVRFIVRDTPGGPSPARNAGLAVARGEHIMFLDDDDLLRPETLDRLSAALTAHPECVAVTAACRLYTENVGSMKVYHPPNAHVGVIWRELLFSWWANSGQMMFRTEVIRAIGGYDPQYLNAQDRKLWLNVAIRGPVCVLPFVAMEYRQHARQISKHDGIRLQRQKIWKEFIAALPLPLQREARGVRRAGDLVQQSVESRSNGRYLTALQQQLRGCLAAPALLRSPITRRPLWWGIKKCLLGVRTP